MIAPTKPVSTRAAARLIALSALDRAFSAHSFLEFVQYLNDAGVEFRLRGKNPVLHVGENHFRMRTLGRIASLRDAFFRWEDFVVTFEVANLEVSALHLRLKWMTVTGFRCDVPAETGSLMNFVHLLGFDEVADALAIAFMKQDFGDESDRFRYFEGICGQKTRALSPREAFPGAPRLQAPAWMS